MPEQHALLSASGSHKWLHCTPSARLEEKMPEQESVYANEGRLAHEIGELKLKKQFTDPMGPKKYKSALKKLQENPLYQDEMDRYTDMYVEHIAGIIHSFTSPPYIAIEKRLDYSQYAPEGFGTGDCIIIGGNTLHVIDLKYGKGVPVSAKDNPQMKLYALGAFTEYSFLYQIEKISTTIIQPRLDNISNDVITIDELLKWGAAIAPTAQKAFFGEGEHVPGEWCRFCRAKALCRARADFNMALDTYKQINPALITNDEIGRILQKAKDLAAWAKDLEEYALSELLKGNQVEGWKAVEGRSNRRFINQDEAFAVVKANGIDEAMLYERKPITLTAVEKLLGEKRFNELLGNHVEKPKGSPTLATIEDKRSAYQTITLQEAFGN
ncbi:MAG TPA: DUF2800 domain-containing protein [Pseudobacteroides sp.]|uniref:DUF2800 domain-containing protein n=1 Tax=Pseudobacteroides sp. TaxID=1968840 RepID=UPI002F952D07